MLLDLDTLRKKVITKEAKAKNVVERGKGRLSESRSPIGRPKSLEHKLTN